MGAVAERLTEISRRINSASEHDAYNGAYSLLKDVLLSAFPERNIERDLRQLTVLSMYEAKVFSEYVLEALRGRFPDGLESVEAERSRIKEEAITAQLAFYERKRDLAFDDRDGLLEIEEEEQVFNNRMARKMSAVSFVGVELTHEIQALHYLLHSSSRA